MRAFIALAISERLARQLNLHAQGLAQQLSQEPLRWIPPENYHITLVFLGDIPSQQLPCLESVMASLASQFKPLRLEVDDVQWFPSVHEPRLLVATLMNNERLLKLQGKLVDHLRQQGFKVDSQSFRPHISLARAARRQQAKNVQLKLAELATEMDKLVLFESQLGPNGSSYRPLAVSVLGV